MRTEPTNSLDEKGPGDLDTSENLSDAYAGMAEDLDRESTAREWTEGLVGDVADEIP